MKTRTPNDDNPLPHAAGRWARAREWLNRLLGRGPSEVTLMGAMAPASTEVQVARMTADELALVRKDLRKVLDQHAEARRVMRYLRALEHGLHKKGRGALEELPVEVLRRALGQLDALVSDRGLPGLATLRSKAAIAIAERERLATAREQVRQTARHDVVQVEEDASHTVFLEVSDEWERSFTGSSHRAPFDDHAEAASVAEDRAGATH